jgi:hypothetical protein
MPREQKRGFAASEPDYPECKRNLIVGFSIAKPPSSALTVKPVSVQVGFLKVLEVAENPALLCREQLAPRRGRGVL